MWPLSALAVFLAVRPLVAWQAAAFVAGLAFAFTPLRAVAVPHIQTMATFGVPLCLVGLHGYVRDRQWPWLVLFGLGWVHQGFANGYYILYGGLTIGLWALVPMLLKCRAVHDETGVRRSLEEIIYFSAGPQSWFEVGGAVLALGKGVPGGQGQPVFGAHRGGPRGVRADRAPLQAGRRPPEQARVASQPSRRRGWAEQAGATRRLTPYREGRLDGRGGCRGA